MLTRTDPAEVSQRLDNADQPMTAHSKVAGIVEKDDPCRAGRVARFLQHRTDKPVTAARFKNQRESQPVMLSLHDLQTFGHSAGAKFWGTGMDNPCWLPARVGIDVLDFCHGISRH